MTKHRIIVHEDRNPFVRTEVFDTYDQLRNMLARTHNGLLDKGYAVRSSDETADQRVVSYGWVSTPDEKPRIHVSVLRE